MKFIVTTAVALFAGAALADPPPIPRPPIGGSPPHGYTTVGSFYLPRQGAQYAVPKAPGGSCPHGWLASGSACLRSGR